MFTNVKNIALLVLSAAVIVLFFIKTKKPVQLPAPDPIVLTHIETKIQVKDTTIFKKGKDIRHDSIIYVQVPVDVKIDTAAILKDYFAKVVYRDTLNFSEGSVIISDIISQNRIQARAFNPKINQKTTIITNEITHQAKEKGALYWGIMATKLNNDYGFGGGVMYKTAKSGVIQLGITNTKQIQLGYYSKIF